MSDISRRASSASGLACSRRLLPISGERKIGVNRRKVRYASQGAVDVGCRLSVGKNKIDAVGKKTTSRDEESEGIDRRQAMTPHEVETAADIERVIGSVGGMPGSGLGLSTGFDDDPASRSRHRACCSASMGRIGQCAQQGRAEFLPPGVPRRGAFRTGDGAA